MCATVVDKARSDEANGMGLKVPTDRRGSTEVQRKVGIELVYN